MKMKIWTRIDGYILLATPVTTPLITKSIASDTKMITVRHERVGKTKQQ
jgi:hypothetical protein